MDETSITRIAASILRYLRARPESADTVEGVHLWWIDWSGPQESPVTTQLALERLERDGQVEKILIANRLLWRKRRNHNA